MMLEDIKETQKLNFLSFYEQYHPYVLFVVQTKFNQCSVQDLAQEIMIKSFVKFNTFDQKSTKAWLSKIIYHHYIDKIKTKKFKIEKAQRSYLSHEHFMAISDNDKPYHQMTENHSDMLFFELTTNPHSNNWINSLIYYINDDLLAGLRSLTH
jgi:DNA-directed RNA polymerase specialized sigma24 family protein